MSMPQHSVLNIAAYRFVDIDDPQLCVDSVRENCDSRQLKGTVLIAHEGINIFLAGAPEAIHDFLAWLRQDNRFADIPIKYSESASRPFGRLRVKHKREIITFRHEAIRPQAGRANAVDPATLQRWLDQGHDDSGREVAMVDTRNAQEAAHGTFDNAITLPIISFTELPDALEAHRESLRDKTVVSFCTGGIRCEKAAIWMREAGYGDVLQLDGGILGYFEQAGGAHYQGNCFVFDQRVALQPDLLPATVVADEPPAA